VSEKGRSALILLVEDNPADARLVRESLRNASAVHRLEVAVDGEQALERVRCSGAHRTAQRPDLILLDLNLPRKDGRQVLAELKADAELSKIPVVVLTSSTAERDVSRAYALHANCYVAKAVDLDVFFDKMRVVESFWLGVAQLPAAAGE